MQLLTLAPDRIPGTHLARHVLDDTNPPADAPRPGERAFRVADWLVEPRLHRLTKGETVVDLEPKIMHVLVRLARRPGDVVERDTLLDEVWKGTVVTGHVLNRSISQLRKALGDDADDPTYIETIPKSGYRLIAAVRPATSPADDHWGDGMAGRSAVESGGPYVQDGIGGPGGPGGPGGADSVVPAAPSTPGAGRRSRVFRLERRHVAAAAGVLLIVAAGAFGLIRGPGDGSAAATITSIRPITSFPGNELDPAFSPEGDRIAYVGADADGNVDVFVKLVDSGDPVRMTHTDEAERAPAWSPDGTRLAFIRVGAGQCHIVVMPALGGNERHVADCGVRTYPSIAWTADGRGLISSERETVDSPFRLWLTSLETLERRALTDPPRYAFGDVDPAVSPGGRTLAFARGTTTWTKDLFRLSLSGESEPERISTFRRDVQGLDWMDEDRLVFAANLSGQYGLWTILASGASLTPVPSAGGWTIRNPAVATGSGRISYEASSHDPDIWRMPLASSATPVRRVSMDGGSAAPSDPAADARPEPHIRSSRWDFYAAYSPDGLDIAFVSTRSGSFELWLADSDGSNARQVTDLDAAWIGTPFWSPDGSSILFDANLDGQLELFVLDIRGHAVDRLTDSADHDLASGWSRDGRSVYFASEETGAWQMWKLDVTSGSARRLTNGGAYRAVESADGSTVYFHRLHEGGLWAVPVSGGEERLVSDSVDPRMWRAFTLEGTDLYHIGYEEEDGFYLSSTDLTDGATSVLHRFERNPGYTGLTISPDRRWVLYTMSEASESDLLLLEDVRLER